MNSFTMRFDMKPVPKERARTTRTGHTYTPQRTRDAEAYIAEEWRRAGGPKFEGPLEMIADFDEHGITVTIRDGVPGSKLRGDLTNLLKTIEDGLNKVAYKDDKQVCMISAAKH